MKSIESKTFKKLSRSQQAVVNMLMVRDCFIIKSKFYNHNKVQSRVALISPDGFEYYGLMQFTRPTFEVLLRKGIIKHPENSHPDIYILNEEA